MSVNDREKDTFKELFDLDDAGSNTIIKIVHDHYNFQLVDVDGDLYYRVPSDHVLLKIDDIKLSNEINHHVTIIKNIKNGEINKSCDHKDCSQCKKQFVHDDIKFNEVSNGIFLRYLYEKINILENEVKSLKLSQKHDVYHHHAQDDDKYIKPKNDKTTSEHKVKSNKEFTFESAYDECIEMSKKNDISIRLYNFHEERHDEYLIHWTITSKNNARFTYNKLKEIYKDKSNARNQETISKIGQLIYEKDNILIYCNILKYAIFEDIQNHFKKLFD